MPQKRKPREIELKEDGWIKQITIGEPRLSECVELYESLDYEVNLESERSSRLDEKCRKCYELEGEAGTVKTIYVRPKTRSSPSS